MAFTSHIVPKDCPCPTCSPTTSTSNSKKSVASRKKSVCQKYDLYNIVSRLPQYTGDENTSIDFADLHSYGSTSTAPIIPLSDKYEYNKCCSNACVESIAFGVTSIA